LGPPSTLNYLLIKFIIPKCQNNIFAIGATKIMEKIKENGKGVGMLVHYSNQDNLNKTIL
jgi:hypothetical protein